MRIDIKEEEEFTIESVKELMRSVDDSKMTQYRVTEDGYLFLSEDVGNRNLDGILFRLETNGAFGGYAGPNAANDESWVERVFNVVKKNWPHPESTYIDNF